MTDSSHERKVTGGFSGNSHDRRIARRKKAAEAAAQQAQILSRTKLPNGATFTVCRPAGGTTEPEVNHVIAEKGGI